MVQKPLGVPQCANFVSPMIIICRLQPSLAISTTNQLDWDEYFLLWLSTVTPQNLIVALQHYQYGTVPSLRLVMTARSRGFLVFGMHFLNQL